MDRDNRKVLKMDDFTLKFSQEEDGEYIIFIYDKERVLYAMVQGTDFPNVLKHAFYAVDPLFYASVFDDYYEFALKHDIIYDDENLPSEELQ